MLHVPARPGMPEIMPTEIVDPRLLQRRVPGLCAHLVHRLTLEAENVRSVPPEPFTDDDHGFRIERDRDRLPRLRLIGMHPGNATRQIYLRPLQTGDFAFARTGRQCEEHECVQIEGVRSLACREQGRRPNEGGHKVTLLRPFYMGEREVTNAQFRQFKESHNSGSFGRFSFVPETNLAYFAKPCKRETIGDVTKDKSREKNLQERNCSKTNTLAPCIQLF